jgi:uracil-DNA glycosylase family 4
MSALTELYAEIARCRSCELYKTRNNAVPGDGPEDAKIMFIGEAPGFHEDRQGRPFVGTSGKFLEELLASINLHREQVYICNVIKSRPPENRDPLPNEIAACAPFLDRQLEIIKPRVIVTLGRFSMAKFFADASISRIHGQPMKRDGIIYIPMFHPAAALHQPKYRSMIEQDFLKIPAILAELSRIEDTQPPVKTEQLSLF